MKLFYFSLATWALLLSLIYVSEARTDYIDCNQPCNGGDVNYELTASMRTMNILNYTYYGRTYSRDGDPSFLGPTMRIKPGQSLWIKLRNELYGENGPPDVTVENYWKMLQNPGEAIKYQYYKRATKRPDQMKVDTPNIPSNFDHTNLHVHGLDVEVHMFDPLNTSDPTAPHVELEPGQCYCYRFNVPEHHPDGMYWYHPHLHGSTAVQMWSGMMGVLYVDGQLLPELENYGITNTQEFVITDPALRKVSNKPHDVEVDEFLMGQTTLSKIHPFLVNGELTPGFQTAVGQVLHLRALSATTENENTFIIYRQGEENQDWNEVAIPFWIIGSDGVTKSVPREHKIIVMAGGQREEMLLLFDEPGNYVISQQGIEGMQFFDMLGHPHSQILATITVTEEDGVQLPTIPIKDMRFTPGYSEDEDIESHQIAKTETIIFSMGANRDQAPFPQYYVNGKAFDPDAIDFDAYPGEAVEYILVNANHNVHPFHIHVNRFQVQEMGSELSTTKYPVLKHLLEFDSKAWRDTVVVPPNGRARIWVQYKNYTGKTVFHCHFLAHEDTGMMSVLFIGPQDFVLAKYCKEHPELFVGVSLGVLLAAVLIFVLFGKEKKEESYAAVSMNELKAKAMD